MKSIHKCECPEDAVRAVAAALFGYEPEEEKARDHRAGECPGDYQLRLYERAGKQLWLCSCCWTFGDKPVATEHADVS